MKKLFIFDFDGTLVNTFYDSVIAYNKAMKNFDLSEYSYDSLETIDYDDFISSMTHNEKVLEEYGRLYMESPKEYTLPYEGIENVLVKLMEDNKELAICSNRSQNQLEEYTDKFFPDIKFKYIIGYVYGEAIKPDPHMINKILKNENYNLEEIVYIGDKKEDILTAKNVNIDAIIVKWGQGNKEAYEDSYPIGIISEVNELLNY